MAELLEGYKLVYSTEAYPQSPSEVELRVFKSTSLVPSTTDPTNNVEREDLNLVLDYGSNVQILKLPLRKIDPPGSENENIAEDPDGPYPIQILHEIMGAFAGEIIDRENVISEDLSDKLEEFLATYVEPSDEDAIEGIILANASDVSGGPPDPPLYEMTETNVSTLVNQLVAYINSLQPTERERPQDVITALLTKYQIISERPSSSSLEPNISVEVAGGVEPWSAGSLDVDDWGNSLVSGAKEKVFNGINLSDTVISNYRRGIAFNLPDEGGVDTWDVTIDCKITSDLAKEPIIDPYMYLFGPEKTSDIQANPALYLIAKNDDGGQGVDSRLQIRLTDPRDPSTFTTRRRFTVVFTSTGIVYDGSAKYADIKLFAKPVT